MRSGILLIDKPPGITSHDVVARTRRAAGTRKVGHAGTLDPMATGLLVLGIESATRLLTYLVGLDKEYFATIRLGQSTSTDDAEGEPTGAAPAATLTEAQVEEHLAPLRGEIQQVPSSVSAIKVGGTRAYALARAGEELTLAARRVTVSALEVLERRVDAEFLDLDVRVECSSGTYIRAIARDLGAALGVGGHLTALRRSRIGPFGIADAAPLENLDLSAALLAPSAAAARLFPQFRLSEQQELDLGHGKRLAGTGLSEGGPVAAVARDGRLCGLVEVVGGIARPLVNFPADPSSVGDRSGAERE
ncbi:tRNA pseudouridine(55) synthase TruB [soil metagenome]